MQDDNLKMIQGTSVDHGGSRLAFVGGDGHGGARIDAWNAADEAWQTHWRLRPGQVFAAGGSFLRVAELQAGGAREVLVLAPAGDTGAIAVPAADQPLVPLGGSLDIGQTRVELIEVSTDGTATARAWPKLYPVDRTAPEDVRELALAVGEVLEVGTRTFRVERILGDAGDIPAFVVFSAQP